VVGSTFENLSFWVTRKLNVAVCPCTSTAESLHEEDARSVFWRGLRAVDG
jgi:hypothetical protein